ncbi:hypothetical protein ACNKHS_01045 [Shigella flexneri]
MKWVDAVSIEQAAQAFRELAPFSPIPPTAVQAAAVFCNTRLR